MTKNYDYWLIVWFRGNEEIHEPACFQQGINPREWCEIMLDRSNNTRADNATRYTRFEIYRLVKQEGK